MATLKKILGAPIQVLDSDPVEYAGSWSSGGSINTGRAYGGSAGSNNEAAMYFGGYTIPTNYANTEQYDGTSWTEVADLVQSRTGITGSFGTLTAAVAAGGDNFPTNPSSKYSLVEEWNGSSWAEVNNLPTATTFADSAGTLTAGLFIGGNTAPSDKITEVYEYDGTNWTAGGDMNEARQFARLSCGTQTAALVCGGTPPFLNETEIYNGSSWTEVGDLNTPGAQGGGGGTSTSAITSGNQSPAKNVCESWDGTSWTEVAERATDNYAVGGTGASNQDGIIFAGYDSSPASFPTATEEWSFPPATSTARIEGQLYFNSVTGTLKGFERAGGIPAATWSSGGALNTGRLVGGGFGFTIPTAVCAGGYNPGGWKTLTEEYNGSAFTEVNDMPTAIDDMGSGGSLTAGIIFGGEVPPSGSTTNKNFGYDGTNWTELTNLNTARRSIGGAGIQTSALAFGGQEPGSASAKTESWDGTSWTETSDLNTARMGIQGAGHSNTAAIGAGGGLSPVVNNVEQWDGSSWTEKNNLNTARSLFAGGGVSTAALFYGGYVGTPSYSGKTESWNGTSMTEVNDMATGRGSSGALPAGGAVSQIAAGGNPQPTASSETFEAEATLSTVTVS